MEPLERILQSPFRRRFRLMSEDVDYIHRIGLETVERHAADFVRERLSPAFPLKDGHQTPMRGHPVFKAQHACACCCRGCLERLHGIPRRRALSAAEQGQIVALLMQWIQTQPLSHPARKGTSRRASQQGLFEF